MFLSRKNQKSKSFRGWYFKQQNADEAFAVIAAIHNEKSSVQIITKEDSYVFDFENDYEIISKNGLIPKVRIGRNYFSQNGILINIDDNDVQVKGKVRYYSQQPPKHSMMGPFKYVWFVPCIHEVFNIYNIAMGKIVIRENDSKYLCELNNATGYIEGDKGNSFPEKYLWTQCSLKKGRLKSITTAVAVLSAGSGNKFNLLSFTGCTCMFIYNNKEHHIATYKGAKVETLQNDYVRIRQGKLCLEIFLLDVGNKHILRAPVKGKMNRNIVESVSATIRYRLMCGNRTVFDISGANSGYECEI